MSDIRQTGRSVAIRRSEPQQHLRLGNMEKLALDTGHNSCFQAFALSCPFSSLGRFRWPFGLSRIIWPLFPSGHCELGHWLCGGQAPRSVCPSNQTSGLDPRHHYLIYCFAEPHLPNSASTHRAPRCCLDGGVQHCQHHAGLHSCSAPIPR